METVVQRLERLYKTENWTQQDREWLAEYLKGDISELYLIAIDGFSKDAPDQKIALNQESSSQILSNIHQRIQPRKRVFLLPGLLVKIAVAASVIVVLCIGYVLRKQLDNWINPVKYEETVALKGELKLIQLTDGTNIWLNADSRLRYPDRFKESSRDVTLSGEAYFAVAHNAAKPFIIHSGKINTQVLGTSLDVKAYRDDETIKVTVVSGKVGILMKGTTASHPAVFLTPNMQIVFNNLSETLVSETIDDASAVTNWRQGKLQYHNAPLPEVLADVGRKYNVVIKADKNLLNCTLYADFNNLSLQKVLKIISSLVNGHIIKEANDYRLRGKGCVK